MPEEPTMRLEPLVAADVDPEIRAFQQYVARAFAGYPQFSIARPVEARAIAESVRAPLTRGGPAMTRTLDRTVRADGFEVPVRIYYPTDAASSPALVYLHGGGWVFFSIETHDRLMREYASRAGIVVVGVDYLRAPEARFPAALTQVTALLRWLKGHGATLGIDPDMLAIGGDSAGANLAIGAALSLRDAGSSGLLKALLLNYGVYDNDFATQSYGLYGSDSYMLTTAEMGEFWDQYLPSAAERTNPLACPARAVLAGLPPTFLAIAECDVLRDENLAMARRLEAAAVQVESTVYAGTTHSFLEAVSMAAVSDRAFADAASWLQQALDRRE